LSGIDFGADATHEFADAAYRVAERSMAERAYFDAKGFKFLRDLARNNDRAWFGARKAEFEARLRDPFLHLIADLAAPLAKISPHFRADPRPSGGSMFRICRDTRFANDKSPYKTWLGARLFHERARQVHAPLFYLHIQPGRCFAGGGLWHPEGPALKRVRDFLVDNPASWTKATRGKRFRERFALGGESLTRPPAGYDPSHVLIEDLRRKDFVAIAELSDADAMSPRLRPLLVDIFKGAAPMIDYLCAALDLEF
jgi:uncharacterized protein (TIGR02453 family)